MIAARSIAAAQCRRLAMLTPFLSLLFLAASAAALEIGDKVPPITMGKQLVGERVDPSASDGKTVYMVEIWSTTCNPCAAAVPLLNDLDKRRSGAEFKLVGLSMDGEAETEAFIKKYQVEFSNFLDSEKAYFAFVKGGERIGTPLAFIIDRDGVVVWKESARDNIEPIINKAIAGELTPEKAKELMRVRDAMDAATRKGDVEAIKKADEELLAVEPDNPRGYEIRAKLINYGYIEADYVDNLKKWRENCADTPDSLTTLMREAIDRGDEEALRLGVAAGERAMEISSVPLSDTVEYLAACYEAVGEKEKAEALPKL